jgi:GNAT superfamily N-acetyltransferase
VELRVIQVGGTVLRTFGVVDLCVRPGGRSRGLAAHLLAELTEYARACGMDFIILFADDDRVYARNGWARVSNRCTWVRIHEHTTLGLATDSLADALMVKATGDQPWPDSDADLLGHVF